jgi:hypothetical protein
MQKQQKKNSRPNSRLFLNKSVMSTMFSTMCPLSISVLLVSCYLIYFPIMNVTAVVTAKQCRLVKTTTIPQFAFVRNKFSLHQQSQYDHHHYMMKKTTSTTLCYSSCYSKSITKLSSTVFQSKSQIQPSFSFLTTTPPCTLSLCRFSKTYNSDDDYNNDMNELLDIGGDPSFFLKPNEMTKKIMDTVLINTLIRFINNNNMRMIEMNY